jgi:rSAM/selenodomain-associated transferase 1
MARAPRPGETKTELEPLLGADGCARLQRALIARAGRWAAATGDPYIAYAPSDAREEIAALAPEGARLFAQMEGHEGERVAAAFRQVSQEHGGPVVVVGTDQPGLSDRHARDAADDLGAGVDVTLGPATAGGYYLLGASRFDPALFAVAPEAWGGATVMDETLRSVLGAGLSIGWLRPERDLAAPSDVAALLADPCAPSDIRAALTGAAPGMLPTHMAQAPRVLICDDAAGFRLLTRTVLADAGFDVVGAAEEWEEAVAMATEHQPDAIVLDLWLPTFEREQVERVHAACPTALLAVVSSLAAEEAARMVDGIDGVGAVVSKRDPPDAIVAALRERLNVGDAP